MKKNKGGKKSLGKQLISGCVYVALSAVIVAVSVNTAINLLPDTEPIKNSGEAPDKISLEIPKAQVIPSLPDITLPDSYDYTSILPDTSEDEKAPVSDTVSGVDAVIVEEVREEPLSDLSESTVPEVLPLSVPQDADLGFNGFIKPVDGYVTVGQSLDVPVYSPTMFDYRTHTGVDISADVGESVKTVNGGVITDIYKDDLLGHTVCIRNADGFVFKYSNLLPVLSDGVEVGAIIETGAIIGGVGESAIGESAQGSHLHLEIYGKDGEAVNPEELIEF